MAWATCGGQQLLPGTSRHRKVAAAHKRWRDGKIEGQTSKDSLWRRACRLRQPDSCRRQHIGDCSASHEAALSISRISAHLDRGTTVLPTNALTACSPAVSKEEPYILDAELCCRNSPRLPRAPCHTCPLRSPHWAGRSPLAFALHTHPITSQVACVHHKAHVAAIGDLQAEALPREEAHQRGRSSSCRRPRSDGGSAPTETTTPQSRVCDQWTKSPYSRKVEL